MRELKNVLVCVDLSEYSEAAMEYGVALARGMGMDLVVINVINIRDVNATKAIVVDFPIKLDMDEYVERTMSFRSKKIQELVDKHFPEKKQEIRIIVDVGVPFKSILEAVEKEKIDIVVTGNKGRGNVVGTLLGSNAEKVFRHSKVPVLSVRNDDQIGR